MNENQKQKKFQKRQLLKINIITTVLVAFADILVFLFHKEKSSFTTISLYANIFLLFPYCFMLFSEIRKHLSDIKEEAKTYNYSANVLTMLSCMLLVIICSAIGLVVINPEAANLAFIFSFFLTSVSMLIPSIVFLTVIYLIVPAFIIPAINEIPKKQVSKYKKVLIILFLLFVCFIFYKLIANFISMQNVVNTSKFKSDRVTIKYSTKYLKFKNIGDYTQKKLLAKDIKVPIYYTQQSFPYDEYIQADIFCGSMNAKVPNYLEIYHIIFNKFDTFGEKYYWTSESDNGVPLVLHFKNMSYELIKKPQNIVPQLYCVAKQSDEDNPKRIYSFHRRVVKEATQKLKINSTKQDMQAIQELLKSAREEAKKSNVSIPPVQNVDNEKKHVSFNIKEVPEEYMDMLIKKGYSYNKAIRLNSQYELGDSTLSYMINRDDKNNIRLCYFPFSEYENMTISQEKEIWKQSFCSPSFILLAQTPVMKTKNNKDSYCLSMGGRLPNIPELMGILKTFDVKKVGVKFWVNSKVTGSSSSFKQSITINYKDEKIISVNVVDENSSQQAYAFCIKDSQKPSLIISNYKSRFRGIEGASYAKEKCNKCQYFELPDTVLQQ